VQAYQKRAPYVIERLSRLAESLDRRFMVRLVKGAYWDSEIKRAQIGGMPGFPVFTNKSATDLSYLACAELMLRAGPRIFPQFATHNAYTLAAVHSMATAHGVPFEMQRLHGMGEELYRVALDRWPDLRLRVYAPVGPFADLLAYLVRRLLENGANSSFVHKLHDSRFSAQEIAADPVRLAEKADAQGNPRIVRPLEMFNPERRNSRGVDLANDLVRAAFVSELESTKLVAAGPIVAGRVMRDDPSTRICRPSDREKIVGTVAQASAENVGSAISNAVAAYPDWNDLGGDRRAATLLKFGDALERELERLAVLISCEAGRTIVDSISEVREAVDFCRFYGTLARAQFERGKLLRGPVGERNELSLKGRGVFICVSPWNFPLSIFVGQVAAALAAGNTVVAKPAPQTPLVAFEAVRLFHSVCEDPRVLNFLPGGSEIASALISDPRHSGVAFTGSTAVARAINRSLAERPGPIVPFIAETGGLNGMFVDSTALEEHVIDDVVWSAFGAAGQRCSSARVLVVPEVRADELITSIAGAMDMLIVGDPTDIATDVGPTISDDACVVLDRYANELAAKGRIVRRVNVDSLRVRGSFFGPIVAEIPSLAEFDRETFGPVLHVVRYKSGEATKVARELAEKGYGLTLGVHTRLQAFFDDIRSAVPAGNIYLNRTIIGAAVESQPFGGEGLSGTGPKSGSPNTLLRYANEQTITINVSAQGGDPELLNLAGPTS
jgi:RHH-type proline utilization regulon transcriptional repressor/proline dehydrogenase/delta 1-pyrroline-5-carboxylate dehydrogenase